MSLANQNKNIDGGKWSISHAKWQHLWWHFMGPVNQASFGGIYGGILEDMSIISTSNTFGGKLTMQWTSFGE